MTLREKLESFSADSATGDVEAHCGSDGVHTHHFSLHLDVIGFAVSCN